MSGEPDDADHITGGTDIAIIGMAGRFPGAGDVERFWTLVRDGAEAITFFSEEELLEEGIPGEIVRDERYVRAKGFLDGADLFDAEFFGFSPRDAGNLDPQQRLFLECAWEALEHAGVDPGRTPSIGVYAGSSTGTYLSRPLRELSYLPEFMEIVLGNDKDMLATRTSYKLDLTGPSVCVQSACSTSLVAVHTACQGLLSGDCDIALAGGVSVMFPLREGYLFQEDGIYSRDGHCRAFDAAATGTVPGDGAGLVVLKMLDDALADGDTVHAVIKGTAVNNDGAAKVGFTAPSVTGQADVIRAAHRAAGVHPDTIGYVEAHGTGTALGDPVEIAALTRAFRARTGRSGYCGIGSVKAAIGHLDVAAGIAGLIKTVLALEHATLPPAPRFERPNPALDLENSPFSIGTRATPWPSGETPRRAGVSSFGIGGTNAHVVLEEAPPAEPARDRRTGAPGCCCCRPAPRRRSTRPQSASPRTCPGTLVSTWRTSPTRHRWAAGRSATGASSSAGTPPRRCAGCAARSRPVCRRPRRGVHASGRLHAARPGRTASRDGRRAARGVSRLPRGARPLPRCVLRRGGRGPAPPRPHPRRGHR